MSRQTFHAIILIAGLLPAFCRAQGTPEIEFRARGEEAEAPDAEAFSPSFVDTTVSPHIIAFGSCNKLDKPQTMWQAVSANNPDLWIWLGDIIYADTTNMKALAAHYRRLKTSPDYKQVRTNARPARGRWSAPRASSSSR